jgi:hypothetical protein
LRKNGEKVPEYYQTFTKMVSDTFFLQTGNILQYPFRPSASLPRAESEVPLGYLDITGHERQKLNLTQSGTA